MNLKMIKLSEQSPEYDKDVLVKLSDGKFAVAQFKNIFGASMSGDEDWVPSESVSSYDNGYSGVVLLGEVIEWCELPE
jgi:hypothetical protein